MLLRILIDYTTIINLILINKIYIHTITVLHKYTTRGNDQTHFMKKK